MSSLRALKGLKLELDSVYKIGKDNAHFTWWKLLQTNLFLAVYSTAWKNGRMSVTILKGTQASWIYTSVGCKSKHFSSS